MTGGGAVGPGRQAQSGLTVRPLGPDDHEAWLPLWRAYLSFYKATVAPEVTAETWRRLNDPGEPVNGLVAELAGTVVGIVHWIPHASTWTVGPYVYLQDLFTAEAARGRGVATSLIEAVCVAARGIGASRVHWLTHETNDTAIRLYQSVAERSGFIQFRKLL